MNKIKELTAHLRRLMTNNDGNLYNCTETVWDTLNQIEVVSELLNGKIQRITAGQFLAEKGIHSLDTKKRYDEVIKWMEEYANTIQPTPTWVEIKSEDDLPKEEGYYWVINSFDDIFIEDFSPKDIIDRDIWLDHRTHYQPIHKPQQPNKLH